MADLVRANTPDAHLNKWIRQRVFAEHEAGPCVAFQLYHEVEGARKGTLLSAFAVDVPTDEKSVEAYLMSLTNEILGYAASDADATGHVQKYVVRAFYGATRAIQGRHVFRMAPGNDADEGEDTELDSEPRNGRGLVSQSMRHAEAYARLMVNNNDAVVRAQGAMVEKLGNAFSSMMGQMTGLIERMNEAEDRRALREKELRIEERKAKNDELLMGQLASTLPLIANRLAGGHVVPQQYTPRDQIMSAFINGLSEQQLTTLLSTLSPEQKLSLFELVRSFGDKPTDGEKKEEGK